MSGTDARSIMAWRGIPFHSADKANMTLAIALAKRGLGQCWPNPAVGSVIADKTGRVISFGWTGFGGRPHAEAIALASAGETARGATLYATLEPCAHWGKTPPCADAIIKSGVSRVVYGTVDPDQRVAGKGLKRLLKYGIEVVAGPMQKEARWVALGHELRLTAKRPFVQMKLAVDRAGLIPAGGGGLPIWATSDGARGLGHLMRAEADAIMIGYGTMLSDDPDLTCRLPGLSWRSPVRIVLSTEGRLSRHANMLKNLSTAPVWIVSATSAQGDRISCLKDLGAKTIPVSKNDQGRLDLGMVLRALAEQGVTRLLVEGGPSLEANLLKEGLADEIVIFQGVKEMRGPMIMPFAPAGLDAITDNPKFQLADTRPIGEDRLWVYRRTDYW